MSAPQGAERYFDAAATTPVDPRVLGAMMPALTEQFGNPHSLHHFGQTAAAAVAEARAHVAALAGVAPEQVIFTSGSTEANNTILAAHSRIAISPFEHSSVREPALARGATILANDGYRLLPSAEPTDLTAAMAISNETGAWLDTSALTGPLLVDATQAAGKYPLAEIPATYLTLSAHKMFGPKGIGALIFREDPFLTPYLLGGGQEFGLRSGTLNVPGIVGLGEAARLALEESDLRLAAIQRARDSLLEALSGLSDWRTNDGPRQSPAILSLSILGIEGETLVLEADAAGFAISAGAACSSTAHEPSPIYEALGVPTEWARGTVRISFHPANTPESAQELGQILQKSVEKLRSLNRRPTS